MGLEHLGRLDEGNKPDLQTHIIMVETKPGTATGTAAGILQAKRYEKVWKEANPDKPEKICLIDLYAPKGREIDLEEVVRGASRADPAIKKFVQSLQGK